MDITDVLNELKIPFRRHGEHHHVSNNFLGVDCPSCSPRSGKFRLGIGLRDHRCSCWICGGKHLPTALAELSGVDRAEVWRMLDGAIHRIAAKVKGRFHYKVPADVGPMQIQHRRYLRERGFDPDEIAELWGVQGIGMSPRLPWRLFIPVTRWGEVVSWTTRSISQNSVRYLSANSEEESMPIKSLLYGADLARHAVVICEGPIDCWAIGPGAVATFGLSWSLAQVEEASRFPSKTICFDAQPAAQRRAKKLAEIINTFPGEPTRVIRLETGKDAAEADKNEIQEIRRKYLG